MRDDALLARVNGPPADGPSIETLNACTGAVGLTLIGNNSAFSFIGSGNFSRTAGELRMTVVSGRTRVMGDTDGDGSADFMVLLKGVHSLTSADFVQ